MNQLKKILPVIVLINALIALVMIVMGNGESAGPFIVTFFVLLSFWFRRIEFTKGFSFTILIFAAVSAAMYYPSWFTDFQGIKLSILIVPLLQLIMFGMGTAMSLKDFAGVAKMPKAVLIGLICQFTIMPVLGISLATLAGFPPEIAAGVVLIGSSPSGLASNVMAYLSKANLALSVTLTAVSTLLSPLLTPLLMELFAGQLVPIDLLAMMTSIFKIVIVPIALGLLFNRFFHGKFPWLDKVMPLISMGGIAVIITVITAAGRDSLLEVGALLVVVAIVHNASGYFLGYWGGRLFGLNRTDCRTIALEVGMQNGGLASGIALEMGKVSTIGLAPAVFGPWMNISGSSLSTIWRDNPVDEEAVELNENKE